MAIWQPQLQRSRFNGDINRGSEYCETNQAGINRSLSIPSPSPVVDQGLMSNATQLKCLIYSPSPPLQTTGN
ncbi:hypothetical protein [Nostoc sp. CENA543]|uniref:hypothetical protein n=1 Tax=Nostoc sp. CENA543 TaxID=1869241 RepID=UPI0012FFFF92|nr:hypothetical protein [Nostoc sp. CENA543]